MKRTGSLLSLGEALRAEQPVKQHSRLAEALAEVRAERNAAAPAESVVESRRTLPESLKRPEDEVAVATITDAAPVPELATAVTEAAPEKALEELAVVPKEAAIVHREVRRTETVEAFDEPSSNGPAGWRPLIDPTKVVGGIYRSKKIIAATTLAGAVLGVLIALSTPKTYEAGAELLADPRDLNLVEKELTNSGISAEATLAIVDNQVRIMTSGTVLTKVADRLKLADDPEFNGQGGNGLRSLIGSFLPSSSEPVDAARRQSLAITKLAESLSVERSGKTFVIVIRATSQSAEKSALIANTMSDVFLESSGDIQSDAAGRAAGELTSRLDDLRKGVEAAERKVEAFRAENDLIDAQGRLISDDEILKLNEQLSIARARTLEIGARATSTRNVNVDAVLSGVIPEELASPGIQELRSQYSTLKGEADRVAVRLGPKHPSLMAIQAQLAGARDLIATEIRRIVSSSQIELKRAVQLEQQLSSRLAQLKVRQGALSNELVTLREIEREATAKRAVYESFLLRARETGEQQGINSANISVISKAYPPLLSSGPSRSTIAIAFTFLGFLAGIGIGGARGTLSSLRGTATGYEAPSPNPQPARQRRRRATMFDTADEPVPPGPPPESHPAAFVATPDDEPLPTQTAATPAEPKEQTMHQYQPDHWASEQQQPQQQYAPPQQAYAPQAYPQAATPMGYPNPAPFYAQQPTPPMQHFAYPQAPQGQPVYVQPMQAQADPYAPQNYQPPQGYPQPMHAPTWQQPQFVGTAPAAYPYMPQQTMAQPVAYAPAPPPPQQARPIHAAQTQATHHQADDGNLTPIEEIRASLRECRQAIRELAEARGGRRYF